MDDIQQKLLPVFLQEVQDNLPAIESFLLARASMNCDQSALDRAFRAMHTLKGTAGLIKADSIRSIAMRVENILEKHLQGHTCPTQIEYDALLFAHKQVCVLIDCLKTGKSASSEVMSGVTQALDLAEAFPGQSSSALKGQKETSTGIDPFAEDTVFDVTDEGTTEVNSANIPDDLFADDQQFGLEDYVDTTTVQDSSLGNTGSSFFDLFSEDPDFEPTLPKLSNNADASSSHDELSGDARPEPRQNFTCCSFQLATKQYSLPIENMVEISELPQVVDLPLSPPHIYGMVNLRGKVLPVIDIAGCEGDPSSYSADRRMVVVDAQGEEFAFLCDGVPSLNATFSGEKIDPVDFMNHYHIRTH